jgi:hypothetical protein
MASVFVEIPGIGNVEAKNAASESTLRELLKVMQDIKKDSKKSRDEDQKYYDEEKKGGGKGGGGGGNAAGKLGQALGGMLRTTQQLTGGFFALGAATTNIIQSFANAGDTFSGAAAVFSKIPVLGGIFGAVAAAADKVLGSFQSATAGGATFGGSINEFAGSASAAGMTMDKFGSLIARNSEALMTLGGTTEDGAKRFSQMSKEIRGSQIGAQLYGLGMTTEQVNQGMATYMKVYGASGALQNKSTKELAQGAGQYLKELDALAKITGQSREELQKEQEARMKDAQFRAATANLDADQAKMMNNFISNFPKEQQEAVKEMIATGNITSEAGVMLNNVMPGLAENVIAQGNAVRSGVKVSQDSYDRIYANGIKEAQIASKSEEARTQALFNTQQFGQAYIGAAELAKRDVNGKQKALTEQEKAQAAQAAAMEKAKQSIAEMSNQFQMVLANSGILNTLMQLFKFTADIVQQYVVPAFQIFSAIVSTVADYLFTNLQPAFTAVSDFIKNTLYPAFLYVAGVIEVDVVPVLQSIGQVINEYVWPALQWFGGILNDYVVPVLKDMGEFVLNNLTPILAALGVALGVYGAYLAASTVAGLINTAAVIVATVGIGGLAAAAWAAAAPILAIVAPVLALVGLFVLLYKKGWDFSTAMEAVKDNMYKVFVLGFKELLFKILSFLPQKLGGYSAEEEKLAREKLDSEYKELDDREKARDAKRAQNIADRDDDKKDADRKQAGARLDQKINNLKSGHASGLADANKKEAEAKEAAVKNYSDPIALLKQEATQQKSAFIKDVPNAKTADAGKTAIVADADAKKAEETKKAEDAKKAAEAKNGTSGPGPKGPAPATQESAETLLASLNTKMDQLIKINKGTHDVNERQLSVQQSLSGDLYQNIV